MSKPLVIFFRKYLFRTTFLHMLLFSEKTIWICQYHTLTSTTSLFQYIGCKLKTLSTSCVFVNIYIYIYKYIYIYSLPCNFVVPYCKEDQEDQEAYAPNINSCFKKIRPFLKLVGNFFVSVHFEESGFGKTL